MIIFSGNFIRNSLRSKTAGLRNELRIRIPKLAPRTATCYPCGRTPGRGDRGEGSRRPAFARWLRSHGVRGERPTVAADVGQFYERGDLDSVSRAVEFFSCGLDSRGLPRSVTVAKHRPVRGRIGGNPGVDTTNTTSFSVGSLIMVLLAYLVPYLQI